MMQKLAGPEKALGVALRQLEQTLHGVRDLPAAGGEAAVSAALAAVHRAGAALADAGAGLARQAEEREGRCRAEVAAATTRLAGAVARSLNDLLTGIGCDTELALSRLPETDPIRKHVESVARAAERGSVLARDLLAIGREQVLHPRVLHLNELIADLEPVVARLLGPRIQLVLDLAPQLPPVAVDPAGLEQLLLSLTVRARETMAGEGRLGIWTTLSAVASGGTHGARQRRVLLAVTDSGDGLVSEDLAHLCEPFVPAGPGLARGGLGLASACGFVRQSGGAFEVYSRPGEGTIVRVLLPMAAPARPAVPAAGAAAEGGTILLVEDDENVRRPLAELLEDRGYLVLTAPDGATAETVAAHYEGPIHLLVTDVMMPGISGVELADALAPRRPAMKILFTTGFPEAVAEALAGEGPAASGPSALLRKPFTSQALLRRIAELLRHAPPGPGAAPELSAQAPTKAPAKAPASY